MTWALVILLVYGDVVVPHTLKYESAEACQTASQVVYKHVVQLDELTKPDNLVMFCAKNA